ncbi:hypothetical protein PSQ90_09085 [Devosia rhodophyticola]|uniref:Uncharacterized protein n=1 Tax=Devosia rhodophyticola TaxID=3026423 RepID=A0ABY7YTH3_9HYPH|nr:hypothetical protein [Devosia rhodophyticola]WDR04492.1 hypothetical protein PSQ90_09085 [Devosia rhodophyticola]
MQRDETPEIKRRPDGSIDVNHYIRIGMQRRAEQAHAMAKLVPLKGGVLSLRFWAIGASHGKSAVPRRG